MEAAAQIELECRRRHRRAGQCSRGRANGQPAPQDLLPVHTLSPSFHPYPQLLQNEASFRIGARCAGFFVATPIELFLMSILPSGRPVGAGSPR